MEKKPQMTAENKENYYKIKLRKNYFRFINQYSLPKSELDWINVLDLIDINMSKFFNELEKDASILDAGCGIGYLEEYLVKKGFKNIHAIDISNDQIKTAEKCMTGKGINYEGKIRFKTIDILDEFRHTNLKYDLIALIDVLEHFKKYEAFEILELAYAALNVNGIILIRVPNMEDPIHSAYHLYEDITHEIGFTRNSLKQCIRATGFENIEANFEKRKSFKNLPPLHKKFLGLILNSPSESFTTNIIGAGKKIL